jgi:hypothetical protein
MEKLMTKPSCLDAAYERMALEQGWRFPPVFPENKEFLEQLLKEQKSKKNE